MFPEVAAWGFTKLSVPVQGCVALKPDGHVATIAQGPIVLRPVGHSLPGLGELIGPICIVLVGHSVQPSDQRTSYFTKRGDPGNKVVASDYVYKTTSSCSHWRHYGLSLLDVY